MSFIESLQSVLTRSSRRFIWSATAFGLALLLCVFAVIDYDFYRTAVTVNEQVATNVAALTAQDIARNIELYDLSLQSVVEGVTDPDILYQEPGLRQKILFDRSATAPGLGSILVLDAKGDVTMDSLSLNPQPENFSGSDYFVAHHDAAYDIGLFVSRPGHSRQRGDARTISVSRRISKPDGSFGGLVSGSIKIKYFEGLFDKVSMGPQGSIVLLRSDGVLVAHNRAIVADSGADWRSAPALVPLSQKARGSIVSDRSMDGVPRLYAFQKIGDLPLVIVVGVPTARIIRPWVVKTLVLSAVFAIMAGGVLALVWLLESELRRRATAERAAEQMARTDGLTKLANRRWFDEELSRNWARTMRAGKPLSLLMIDVDHFKTYNDTYGHQAGDRVLSAVASVISGAVKRLDDIAARYGGEEFAVLLPDTDQSGVERIAAEICSGVCELGIDHTGNEHKTLTVSIGTATVFPRMGLAKATLVGNADLALYCAKDDGRNTVRHHNVVSPNFGSSRSRMS
ncbi:MAG: sensor domain-containing diguanylate cyclase [Xanthobacteraceae bacterium]|nr:sensor domain-containing diguanylate cyclase [Xanthobacteraceae bacterium]